MSAGVIRVTTVAQLEKAYHKVNLVDAHHHCEIFKTPVNHMRSRTTTQIKYWLEHAEPAIERAIAEARKSYQNSAENQHLLQGQVIDTPPLARP
jgi:hypothetical protein